MRKLILLDRDGTVNDEVHYLVVPDQLKLIPGAAAGIRRLNQAGYAVAIVTNQSGVARGYLSLASLDRVHQRLRELLAKEQAKVDGIYFCPHLPTDRCACRKPGSKLATDAAADLGATLKGVIVIGDRECDILLGRAINATTILVRTGHGKLHTQTSPATPDLICTDLNEASAWILANAT
ncbi:MAG: hypothetical protein RLZZ129_2260 [Verrucomicrobiota bacterium]|jgi:D-glycero-D-manno-heptose 1,7-bisphosphate phosphatase